MSQTEASRPQVVRAFADGNQTVSIDTCPWPDGPLLRIRDGLRDQTKLDEDVERERAIILELNVHGHGWQEISHRTYLRVRHGESNVISLSETTAGKKEAHAELLMHAEMMALSMANGEDDWSS
jgi:hypothetical protein